jgi:hypothetical protein
MYIMSQIQEQFLCGFSEKITLLHRHCFTVRFAKEAVIWISILGKVNFNLISKDRT